jgi:hypothetical protein
MVLLYTVEILTRVGAIGAAELPAHGHPRDRSANASETQTGTRQRHQTTTTRYAEAAKEEHQAATQPQLHTHILYTHMKFGHSRKYRGIGRCSRCAWRSQGRESSTLRNSHLASVSSACLLQRNPFKRSSSKRSSSKRKPSLSRVRFSIGF